MNKKNTINKILFITLSNIGDVILTLPVLDTLKVKFPQSKITVMVGQRPQQIFESNPNIERLIVYNKYAKLREKIRLFKELKKENFDLIVDLRNSLFGALLPAKYRTSLFVFVPKKIKHIRESHLYKLKVTHLFGRQKSSKFQVVAQATKRNSFYISTEDEDYINQILIKNNVTRNDKIVLIAPGARSHIKRWPKEKFIRLIQAIIELWKVKIILVGDKQDIPIAKYIVENSSAQIVDLSGKTSITKLGSLLRKVVCVVTNDSAVMHLASYLNVPTVGIFGPTNELKYGPWSEVCAVVKKDIFCRPCEKAQCRFGTLKCMEIINLEDVLRQVRKIIEVDPRLKTIDQKEKFKRILIVRTDRIGDVLLSTPVIKALRDNYPHVYIAMMVSSYTKDIVEGNPYLDEVIIYDKDRKQRSWQDSLRFAFLLKKKRFDLAIILHPTNRVHLVTFFAGIPRRIGYYRKLGFLLTDKIKHTKQWGEKHELEHNLDCLRCLGIEPTDKTLFMPIKSESDDYIEKLFKEACIEKTDPLLALHPGASCPSKIWPNERFAEAADSLIKRYGFKVLVVAGPKDITLAEEVTKHMQYPAINLAGRISVSQLASLLRKCQLFISNDSGPVHIASAVGTPVISIFGRNQRGLSPQRWRPLGAKDSFLHKEVGCIECLAHNCKKDFVCLKAITTKDVLDAAIFILNKEP